MSNTNSSVPTISVTLPPAGIGIIPVNRQYAILEENLKQLHDIVEAVQQMKDANVSALYVNNQVLKNGEQSIRLSYSCPSLIDLNSDGETQGNSLTSSPSHIDILSSISTPSLLNVKQKGDFADWRSSDGRIINTLNNSISGGEILRRRSWAALEDLSSQKELDFNVGKQRRKTSSDVVSVQDSYSYDERREKRRKRGSIFFRKKKDKTKKSQTSHVWIPVTHGNANYVGLCDWCSKPIETKFALHCEGCLATTHQGICAENISAVECPQKAKNSSKVFGKSNHQQISLNKNANEKSVTGSSQGSSPIMNEEKDTYSKNQPMPEDHIISYSEEVPLVALEFLDEGYLNVIDLDTDPFLGLQNEELDTWTPSVSKDILKKLKEKEIKRQEHIYEFILTEKHHCLTLILMKKIFVEPLNKYLQLGHNVDRMFPRLKELTDIHLKFLYNLRRKQKETIVVDSISDILLEQFSGNAAEQLKDAYGEFCSHHRDAVDIYKKYLQYDHRFAEFVKYCQNNPLLKKKGIPECILFVTQRLTKYPLLIEPLIKTSKENKTEVDKLTKALSLVKDILTEVDSRVAEKEKEDKKLEIYHKIDPKSFSMYRGMKFKKSDVLSNNRKLKFEGLATLMQGRTKMQLVNVIVLSDVLLFLVENNNKFSFFTPDSKPGVVCLQKLLVREKAGADTRGIYLISSNPSDPEMFELKIHKPKDKNIWISSIREAVRNCPEDDAHSEEDLHSLTYDEKQRKARISQLHLHQIVSMLRQKDVEQVQIYEDKIALLINLLATAGVDIGIEPPSYSHLVSEYLDNDTIRKEVFNTIQKVSLLTTSLYAPGTNLSRNASSVGEKQSVAYVSPILPKRAETFGGFDNNTFCKSFVAGVGRKLSQQFQKKVPSDACQQHDIKAQSPSLPSSPITTPELIARKFTNAPLLGCGAKSTDNVRNPSPLSVNTEQLPKHTVEQQKEATLSLSQQDLPIALQLDAEQQSAVVQLISHIYTLASITAQQMSSIDSLEAQLAFYRQELYHPSNEKERKPIYKHNQQLEELRNLQDRLTHEKEQWQREKENEEKELDEKRKQFLKLQEQIRNEQQDITQQREQLYRKLERLSAQGVLTEPSLSSQPSNVIMSSPNSTGSLLVDLTRPADTPPSSSSSLVPSASPCTVDSMKRRNDSVRWKQSPSSSTNVLSLNLMSATNQQKVASSKMPVKQELPLKLATTKSANVSSAVSSSSKNTPVNTASGGSW